MEARNEPNEGASAFASGATADRQPLSAQNAAVTPLATVGALEAATFGALHPGEAVPAAWEDRARLAVRDGKEVEKRTKELMTSPINGARQRDCVRGFAGHAGRGVGMRDSLRGDS